MATNSQFSFEERLALEALIADKIPIREAARTLGRSEKLIYQEIKRTPFPYNAKEAQKDFEAFYKSEKMTKQTENKNIENQPLANLAKRMRTIEVQMEVVIDLLENIQRKLDGNSSHD